MYKGIPSNGLILTGNSGQSVSVTNPKGVNSDRITLLHSMSECPSGIKITFSKTEYYGYGGTSNLSSKEDINISKGSTSGSGILESGNGYYTSVIATINSDNILQFATHNYSAGIGSNYDEYTGLYDAFNNMFYAIASITAY